MTALGLVTIWIAAQLAFGLLWWRLGNLSKGKARGPRLRLEPRDPELARLKAERAKPLRERRTYAKIDAEAQEIVHERLRRAIRG